MQIEIPKEIESLLKRRAEEAGFDDVEQYALHRLLDGDADAEAVALLEAHRERVEEMIEQGYASGPPTEMTKDDWDDLRKQVVDRISENEARS